MDRIRPRLGVPHLSVKHLSADQVTKLRAIDQAATAKNAPTMEKMRALRGDSTQALVRPLDMTAEQRALAREKLQQAVPLLEELRKVNAKAADTNAVKAKSQS